MKILYITSLYSPHILGGAEISIQILVEAMQKRGHELSVLATSDKEGLHKETINGVTVYRGGIKNRYWHYNKQEHSSFDKIMWHLKDCYNKEMQIYVTEVLELEKPDIVSCHNITGWSVAIWDTIVKAKIPIVQVLHDFYLMCINSNMYKDEVQCNKQCVKCKMMRFIHKKKSQKIDAVVGISHYILNKTLNAGYFKNTVKAVIYNGRNALEIPVSEKKQKSNFVFGFIGTLAPNKGTQWLIEQFKKIESDTVSLIIAGKGESSYENSLKKIAEDDERISFIGYVKPENFYLQIDVLVVPSLWDEPLGMVAIEACAYGIPVITSATGGLKEIIKHEFNGLHCNTAIPESLFHSMNEIMQNNNLLKTIQGNTSISVSAMLNPNRLIDEYEEIYKKNIKVSF